MTRAVPTGVLVLGMHRSGTSATASALGERGFALGDELVPAAADNPEGYFEHAAAVRINDELLRGLGRSWQDLRALPAGWLSSESVDAATEAFDDEMRPFFAAHRPWALKDPRLCRVLPFWRKQLAAANERPACLLVLRHPAEVASSLQRRDHMPAELAHVLWLRHVLESLEASQNLPRTSLDYATLLADGGASLDAALRRLGFETGDKQAKLASLRPALRHNIASAKARDESGPWAKLAAEVYAELVAARDVPASIEAWQRDFDALYHGQDMEALADWLAHGEQHQHAVRQHALAQERRADDLQARIDLTDQAFAEEQHRSSERLAQDEKLREELDSTQQAFQQESERSLARMAEAEKLREELDSTQQAFQQEAERSLTRLTELESTRQALEAEAARSLERLEEAQSLLAELGKTQAAFADEAARSLSRLSEIESLDARLRTREAELANERQQLSATTARLDAITATRWWRLREKLSRLRGAPRSASLDERES